MNMKYYCKNEALNDGSSVIIRNIKPEDKPALSNAFSGLSIESQYSRFFRKKPSLSTQDLEYLTEVDFVNHVAICADLLQGEQMMLIGVGRYIVHCSDFKTAEIALTVDDDYQGIGVGSLLLKHLSQIAKRNDIDQFYATLLETNENMMRVLRRSKLSMQQSSKSGFIEVLLDLRSGQKRERA